MFNAVKSVATHINSHRAPYIGAAASVAAGTIVRRNVRLWKEYFADPEAFDAKHPDAR